MAAVGGGNSGSGGDQGKKKGNSSLGSGDHGVAGNLTSASAGNGLDGLDGLDGDPDKCTLDEIRSWGSSFDKLMKNPAGRRLFREFLVSEYSEENIAFWLACEQLKRESNPERIEEKARFIYEDYISILSPKEVSQNYIKYFKKFRYSLIITSHSRIYIHLIEPCYMTLIRIF